MGVLNPDTSWYNYGTQQMLSGARLYTDIVDVNPPMIYYLSLPPFWLAKTLSVEPTTVFRLWVLFFAAASSALGFGILNLTGKGSTAFSMALTHASLITIFIGESFGQREHFMLMMLVPYVFLTIARLEGETINRRLGLFVGTAAAMAIALKPHYALVIVFLEVVFFFNRGGRWTKHFRPEVFAGLAASVVLALMLLIFVPEFLTQAAPLATHVYLPYYHENIRSIVTLFATLAVLIAIYALGEWRAGFHTASKVLLAAAAASALAMLIQFRGFPYHMLAALYFLILASAYRLAKPLPARAPWITFPLVFVGAILFTLNSPFAYKLHPLDGKLTPPGTRVAVLSTNISDGFPWVPAHGLVWTSRFPALWFMPFINDSDLADVSGKPLASDDHDRAEKLREQAVSDLVNGKPDLIVVKLSTAPIFKASFDYFKVLSKDARFQPFFSHYQWRDSAGDFAFYIRKID